MTVLDTPHAPARDWQDVDELDGIDLSEGNGCPHCGADRDALYVPTAGYYACSECSVCWAGDYEEASLFSEPVRGPAVDGGEDD
ncbi:hypothetical protein ACM16X_05035 [Haloarcula japonica]|uniref:hypothetical protein n=1 Tax=Haloarcula japonica TaxID=29282 RepID=UPI0039F687F9